MQILRRKLLLQHKVSYILGHAPSSGQDTARTSSGRGMRPLTSLSSDPITCSFSYHRPAHLVSHCVKSMFPCLLKEPSLLRSLSLSYLESRVKTKTIHIRNTFQYLEWGVPVHTKHMATIIDELHENTHSHAEESWLIPSSMPPLSLLIF